MLSTILDSMRISASNDDRHNMRSHPRRAMDSCVGIIDGKIYPVKNWSQGGALMTGLEHFSLEENQEKEITLKFKLAEKIMDIKHKGKILRRAQDKFAVQFAPLTRDVEQAFKKVMDDYVTQEFANSQA
ncbi:MAG: PilZ domain-containing protein [Alphaproteobacteria bacterium]|nr:PilZ domain-containing protein [Alphaproteobacteria bacterium]NCT06371.1 PilZ domain-containing protein [Alphaproteobacteria bacterium]